MKTTAPKLLAAAAALFLGTTGAQATVTLIFGNATIYASNWANGAGTGNSLMAWGILIDTSGNGFLPINEGYSGSGLSLTAAGTYQPLVNNLTNQPTDDLLYMSPVLMLTVNNTNDAGVVGNNRISAIANVPLTNAGGNSVDTGDHFAIVWFDSTALNAASMIGMRFGLFDDASFTLPADGSTTAKTSAFTGPDPLKLMNGRLAPEPSTLLLSALGALGLLRRRR